MKLFYALLLELLLIPFPSLPWLKSQLAPDLYIQRINSQLFSLLYNSCIMSESCVDMCARALLEVATDKLLLRCLMPYFRINLLDFFSKSTAIVRLIITLYLFQSHSNVGAESERPTHCSGGDIFNLLKSKREARRLRWCVFLFSLIYVKLQHQCQTSWN